MYTGTMSVKIANTMRVYNPLGLTSLRKTIQDTHIIESHIKGDHRLAKAENLAFAIEELYKDPTSSSVTNPISRPHRTHTCALGPLPWMNWSRL